MMEALGNRNLNVSRETTQRLEHFVHLLEKWNAKINLVAKSTLAEVWTRHIEDSAQLVHYIPTDAQCYVDIGSGGGFPGLVLALIAPDHIPGVTITLIESDTRKATFLRTVVRDTGVVAQVVSKRVEDIDPLNADVVSARGVAELPRLLALVNQHLNSEGIALLQKGANWRSEVSAARKLWSFSVEAKKSRTDANAVILSIGDIAHV